MKKVVLLTLWNLLLSIPLFICLSARQQPKSCGVDRRDVKSLYDTAAKRINFVPKRAEVSELVAIPQTNKIGNNTPRFGSEFNTYQVNCRIREYRVEEDGDYHLVLQDASDSTITMVGEIPNPACDDLKNSPYLKQLIAVRTEFEKYILPKHKVKSGYYKLQGVCFFDKIHGQLGVAKNGVEIHPILLFVKF